MSFQPDVLDVVEAERPSNTHRTDPHIKAHAATTSAFSDTSSIRSSSCFSCFNIFRKIRRRKRSGSKEQATLFSQSAEPVSTVSPVHKNSSGVGAISRWRKASSPPNQDTRDSKSKKSERSIVSKEQNHPKSTNRTPLLTTMDASPTAMVKALVPRIPLLGKTFACHAFGMTPTSKYWDLKTELLITMIRSFVSVPNLDPISKSQHVSLKDSGIKGKLWVAKVPIPAPTTSETRQAVINAIDHLMPGGKKVSWTPPDMPAASAEWTGYRDGVAKDAVMPDISETEKYNKLMEEVKTPLTVLYIHGGAMYMMDPASHRLTCARLAKESGGRFLSLRYRLAPQNPFPAALMDCFLAYLYLLYPPPDSLHAPVDPSNLVISGDSAGGNLSTALLALILTLNRIQPDGVIYNGTLVKLPVPAGIAGMSPWEDTTHSFPSVLNNMDFDYIPSPTIYPPGGPVFPKCDIWPTTPARKAIYVSDELRLHPLVNPVAFPDWTGAPPVLIMVGQELLTDEGRFMAKMLVERRKDEGKVWFEEFQAMPHCFAQLLEWIGQTDKCFGIWSEFMKLVGGDGKGHEIKTRLRKTLVKGLAEEELDVAGLSEFSYEQVLERLAGAVEHGNMYHKTGDMGNVEAAAVAKL